MSYGPSITSFGISDVLAVKDFGKKKSPNGQESPWSCPVCGVNVRTCDLDTHFVQELEKLYKLQEAGRVRRHEREPGSTSQNAIDSSLESRWETYQRIKANRQSRLRLKTRKRKQGEVMCPVCNEGLNGSMEQLNNHVELCLRKHGHAGRDEDENVDVEGEGEMYDDYEWANQRLRSSTMLLDRYPGQRVGTESRNSEIDDEDGEGELVVDGDDSGTFGPSQYTDVDVVLPSSESSQDQDRSIYKNSDLSPEIENDVTIKEEPSSENKNSDRHSNNDVDSSISKTQIIESLKCKIRQLESENSSENKFTCLICMENYKNPVISVCCWHVHCENCWLHTLGAKKLCPQCNMITSPTDLRRIYL